MSGTEVTARDLETGETETVVIRDDWLLITDGAYGMASVQRHMNGTVQITVKKAAGPVAADPAMPEVAPNEETPSTSAREPTP